MPVEELDEKSEIKEKQKKALEDLHVNFNQHIKFIADRTAYLQKFPQVKNPRHKYDPNPKVTDFKEEFVENREFSTLLEKPPVDIQASIEAEYKSRKEKKEGPPHRIHGVRHATRVALYTEILHNFKKTLTKKDNKPDDFAENAIRNLAKIFDITEEDVLMLTKIAAFFHDSAREGDGKDYWDHRSAENCYEFLVSKGIKEDIARFFANAARYKSDANSFNEYCKKAFVDKSSLLSSFHYIRQLIAYADTLDIMRCVDPFEGYFIYKFLGEFKEIKEIPLENIEKANQLMLAIREGINAQGDLSSNGCKIKISRETEEYLEDISRHSITPEEKLDMEFNPDPYQCMRDKLAEQADLNKFLNPELTTKEKPIFTANPGFFKGLDFEKLINTPDKSDKIDKLKFVTIKKENTDNHIGSIIYQDEPKGEAKDEAKDEAKYEADDITLVDIFSDKLECPLQATDKTKQAQAEAIVKILKASLEQQVDKSVPLTITANEDFALEHLKLILDHLQGNNIVVKFKCTQNSSNEIKDLVKSYNTQHKKHLGL